jgi:acyl dehydratase
MPTPWPAMGAGTAIPPVAVAVSLQRLVLAAGGERDFNPLHFDSDYARSCGFRAAFANGLFLQAMIERTVTDFVGPMGELRRLRLRMSAPVYIGRVLTIDGTVDSVAESDGWGSVEATVYLRTEDGPCATARVMAQVPTVH